MFYLVSVWSLSALPLQSCSCLVLPCSCLLFSCLVLSCLVLSYLVLSCPCSCPWVLVQSQLHVKWFSVFLFEAVSSQSFSVDCLMCCLCSLSPCYRILLSINLKKDMGQAAWNFVQSPFSCPCACAATYSLNFSSVSSVA